MSSAAHQALATNPACGSLAQTAESLIAAPYETAAIHITKIELKLSRCLRFDQGLRPPVEVSILKR